MMTLVFLLAFPTAAGFLMSWFMLRNDRAADIKRSQIDKNTISMTRFFRIRKSISILCEKHLHTRKPGQVALIDETRCKVCLDRPST